MTDPELAAVEARMVLRLWTPEAEARQSELVRYTIRALRRVLASEPCRHCGRLRVEHDQVPGCDAQGAERVFEVCRP